ncbi:MAG: hypothetical protein Q9200_003404 [Gallowayella weberi]
MRSRCLVSLLLVTVTQICALQTPNPASLPLALGSKANASASANLPKTRSERLRADHIPNISCGGGNPTLCDPEFNCDVPDTQTKLKWEYADNPIHPYAMQEILRRAQEKVEQELTLGDKLLSPSQIPWYLESNGLYIRADMKGWSWRMLNNTLAGLEYCLFRKGIFHEVYVNAVVDPTALDTQGERQLYLLKFPGSPQDQLREKNLKCFDPETGTQFQYDVGRRIVAYNMQELLDAAQGYAEAKIYEGGDPRLSPNNPPWTIQSHGLIMYVKDEGWSWQVLNHTIAALRLCESKQGPYPREVEVYDIKDPEAMSGERRLILKREFRELR